MCAARDFSWGSILCSTVKRARLHRCKPPMWSIACAIAAFSRAVGAGENAAIAQAIDHIGGLHRCSLARFTVEHKIDPQEKSRAAHVADQSMARLQRLQTFDEMCADAQGVLL